MSTAAYHELARRMQTDPTYFARAILLWTPWSKQAALLRSVRDNRRTLALSGHGVGKTRTLASIICEWMTSRPDARVICTASTNRQVHDVLWAEVRALYRGAALPLGGRMLEREWLFGDKSRAVCVSVDDPTAMQGVHSANVLVVIDEAEGLAHRTWDAIDSLLTDANARVVACANPVTPSGYVYDASQRPDLWHTLTIPCTEHPNITSGSTVIPGAVTTTWLDEVRRTHGEGSRFWLSRVLGQYPAEASSALLTRRELEGSFAGGLTDSTETPRAGLDVARFGADRSVLVVFDEHRVLRHVEAWQGADLMETTGRALAACARFGAKLRVDACGLGAGVVDRAREQGHEVDAVDFGAAAVGDWPTLCPSGMTFANRRAELHWVTRSLVREKSIGIGIEHAEVWSDLMLPQIEYDSRGRLKIESKDEIRSRAGRSPDHGDAVHIAMSDALHGAAPRIWGL